MRTLHNNPRGYDAYDEMTPKEAISQWEAYWAREKERAAGGRW